MPTTFLETNGDMKWLADVHFPSAQLFACAILHGNEDSPEKLELFKVNDVRTTPTVLVRDPESGSLVEVNLTDEKKKKAEA